MGRSMPGISRWVNPCYLVVVISFLVVDIHSFTIRGIFRQFCFLKNQKKVSSQSTFLKKLVKSMLLDTLPKQKCKKASNTNNLARPCHCKPPPLAVLLVNNTNAFS